MNFFIKVEHLNLERTLFCGQAFRWKKLSEIEFCGISDKRFATIRQEENGITFLNIPETDLDYWLGYFDIDTDYGKITKQFSKDPTLKKACEFSAGIRVLKQEPFETLISFIISQNNNITRISGIIERLCEYFGEKTENGFLFPTAERLSETTPEDLSPIKTGYRAAYIINAAKMVNNNSVNLSSLYSLNAENAKSELLKITGVGDKVADCVLLFAYGKTTQIPKDVWIKRVMSEFYPDGFPKCVGKYSGIAQQFLFDYIRQNY